MWYRHNFFKYMTGSILVLLVILLLGKIDYFLVPLRNVLAVILLPLLISGLLYYLLRPLITFLTRIKIPKALAILVSFILLLVLVILIGSSIGTMAADQLKQLYKDIPSYINIAADKLEEFFANGGLPFIPVEDLQKQVSDFSAKIVPFLSQGLFSGVTVVANAATALILVPFFLFYFLYDDGLFRKKMEALIPVKHKENAIEVLDDIDRTLSAYITGQALIALIAGTLMYIGYMILGLDYAFVLALFVFITSFIPILGAFIGIIPALLVSLTINPFAALKVLILMIIVQQLEGNLISPQLMGKRMNIHPLTFLVLLLAAASLFGFIGMLVAVPVYAVLKLIIKSILKLYKLEKEEA